MSEALNAAEGGLRKYKPYPAYRESGVEWIGEIPEHWLIFRFKNVACLAYGDSLASEKRDDGNIEVYGSNGQIGMHLHSNTLAPVLIIGRKGSYGKINYCHNEVFAIDTTYFIDKHTTSMDLRWLFYLIGILGLDSYSEDSAVPGLSRDYVYSHYLPIPSSSEQQFIAAFLDRETSKIDALIEKKGRLIELLREKRSALITHAVTKGLDPTVPMKDSGVEWIGEIPEHWDVKKLKHMSSVQFSSVDKKSYEGEIPVRLCNYLDVYYNDFISPDLNFMEATASLSEISKFILRKGDVIITKDSESWDDIAISAYVPSDLEGVLCGYHLAQIHSNNAVIDGEYLFRSFSAQGINDQFKIAANGITRYGLGKYWLDNSFFPTPPTDEQYGITTFLDRETSKIDTLIEKIRQAIERLKEYHTALISAAVTGKIDVREEAL